MTEITTYRVAVLGPNGSGKTALATLAILGYASDVYDRTETVMEQEKMLRIDNQCCNLHITDTPGHLPLADLDSTISTSHAIVLVYSINSIESFEGVKMIYAGIENLLDGRFSKPPITLVGYGGVGWKEKRQVPRKDGERFANESPCAFDEVTRDVPSGATKVLCEVLRGTTPFRASVPRNMKGGKKGLCRVM